MSLSPVQFAAMRDRLEALDRPRGKVLELLLARLTAVVWNTSLGGGQDPRTTESFLLTRGAGAKLERKPRRTKKVREETAKDWGNFMQALMANQK